MYGTVECLVYVRIQCRFVTKEACFILIFFFSFNSYSPSQYNWKGNGQRDRQTDRCYYSAIDITKHFKQVLVQHLLIWLFFSLFFLLIHYKWWNKYQVQLDLFPFTFFFDKKEAQKNVKQVFPLFLKSYHLSKVT